MADELQKDAQEDSGSSQTTHKKKAQIVALVLVGVVVVGLILQAYISASGRTSRQAKREAEQAKVEAAAAEARPESSLSDFAKAQEQSASNNAADAEAERAQKKRKGLLADVMAESGAPGAATDGVAPDAVQAAEQDFRIAERKRVLMAGAGHLGRSGAKPEQEQGAKELTNAGELAEVDKRIAKLTTAPAALEARKRELYERAAAAGIDLAKFKATGAVPITSGSSAVVRDNGDQDANGSFGEVASNREQRDPSGAGPRPGEEVLPTGSIISAVLDMDMVSDYAGNWWALLQRPVYDPSMTFVLFPAGTKIVGKSMRATGANENIQNRMGSVPLWAIRPDGKRIDFKRTAGMDAAGVAALKDQVDRHFLAQFMGVAAYAIIGLGPSFSNYGAEPNSSRDAFAREFTSRSRDAGRSFAEKFLNIVPTVRIRAGTPVKIFVEEDIYVTPWEKIDESHYTRRQ